MPVFLPAAVHSHQTNCVEALLRLQAIINETLEQWRRSAEPPRKQAAALRDVVRAARVTLPGDFKPSSEVAADAYAKLGARGLSEPPKLQKDVDAFSEFARRRRGYAMRSARRPTSWPMRWMRAPLMSGLTRAPSSRCLR